ncbi:YbjN domain-containing protein [Novosphingobium cyanobacteriorum]|uniref:YbjN domain-containing protein n=1 Tax=Novosphingobium cyanobacteriorum TaxID=3024215 RepID=A0ABT6CLU8_9SPHN|nr:YbjN domain-containing protein [Novosphingobium cyanobacteriorum]MDF8334827.1 YbjN domain-containing protein [Novosphingobium cyanobacteriorum]
MKSFRDSICRIIAPIAMLAPLPAVAAPAPADTVSATRPQSIVVALQAAGYTAQLGQDDAGDPLVKADIGGWQTLVVFYDCNEVTHEGCQSLQFNAGFMPERPFGATQAAAFVRDNRFGAVSVNDDKSLNVTWDVITGEGIDPSVFALVVKSYRLALDSIGTQVFPGKGPMQVASASR